MVGIKPILTSTLEKIQGLLLEFEPSTSNQLKTYRIALTEKLKVLSDLDDEILGLIKEEQIDEEIKETGVFRESIHEMVVRIDETLSLESNEGNTDKSMQLNSSITSAIGMGVKAKLPKIALKKFQGDPIQYNPFWDAFSSAVDENQQLSDVDKFNYLKNLL